MNREFEDYLEEGKVYFKKDDFENSINSCTKAIEIDPKCETVYIIRGLAKHELLNLWLTSCKYKFNCHI